MNHDPHRSRSLRGAALALLLVLAGSGLSACQEKRNQGPMERAGEKADETVNDAKRAVEDARD